MIGEAAARVSSDTTTWYPAVPWRQVVGMRNRVVHDYFEVDLEIL
ncbi:MAG: HepT-like ribonuclease domain-containing protein [Pseudonocardiaceae bacterium]